MPPPSAQGSTVSFNGSAIGSLKSWQVTPQTAVIEEITSTTATKIGTGSQTRIVQELACLMVAPGTAQLTLWGKTPFSTTTTTTSVGGPGTLTITFSTGSVSLPAILEDYSVSGRVGQYIEGTAKFRFTGGA